MAVPPVAGLKRFEASDEPARCENPMSVRCIQDPPGSVDWILRTDERALREATPTVRVSRVSEPALSIGVGQDDLAPAAERARLRGIPVVRRMSGGTGLLHASRDIVWSVVVPRAEADFGPNLQSAYGVLGEAHVRALEEFGVAARWIPAPALFEPYCLLSGRGEVLASDGRILGGAAQHLTRDALLHHGVVNVQTDASEVSALFGLPEDLVRSRITDLGQRAQNPSWLDKFETTLLLRLAEVVTGLSAGARARS
jgi:lipoate-protein ligase A